VQLGCSVSTDGLGHQTHSRLVRVQCSSPVDFFQKLCIVNPRLGVVRFLCDNFGEQFARQLPPFTPFHFALFMRRPVST
jgi:hypothetical protein